jgi:hypothetical protein
VRSSDLYHQLVRRGRVPSIMIQGILPYVFLPWFANVFLYVTRSRSKEFFLCVFALFTDLGWTWIVFQRILLECLLPSVACLRSRSKEFFLMSFCLGSHMYVRSRSKEFFLCIFALFTFTDLGWTCLFAFQGVLSV